MAFLKLKPNLADGEKAKVEFHFQQIAESIGFDRLKLNVLGRETLLGLHESELSPEQMVNFIGEHLSNDVSGVNVAFDPKQPEKCGGGG